MQYDVYRNPISAARRSIPFVVALESSFAYALAEHVIAPIVPVSESENVPGRLLPRVTIDGEDYLLMLYRLRTLPKRGLGTPVANLAAHRGRIIEGIDFLLTGV